MKQFSNYEQQKSINYPHFFSYVRIYYRITQKGWLFPVSGTAYFIGEFT